MFGPSSLLKLDNCPRLSVHLTSTNADASCRSPRARLSVPQPNQRCGGGISPAPSPVPPEASLAKEDAYTNTPKARRDFISLLSPESKSGRFNINHSSGVGVGGGGLKQAVGGEAHPCCEEDDTSERDGAERRQLPR